MRSHRILAFAVVALTAGIAHADPASALKQEGLKAAKDRNWDVARERFEQSYALDPRPLTLFNLAVAQEHTDKLLEARASYTSFLDQPATSESEPFRKLARTAAPRAERGSRAATARRGRATIARLPRTVRCISGRSLRGGRGGPGGASATRRE